MRRHKFFEYPAAELAILELKLGQPRKKVTIPPTGKPPRLRWLETNHKLTAQVRHWRRAFWG